MDPIGGSVPKPSDDSRLAKSDGFRSIPAHPAANCGRTVRSSQAGCRDDQQRTGGIRVGCHPSARTGPQTATHFRHVTTSPSVITRPSRTRNTTHRLLNLSRWHMTLYRGSQLIAAGPSSSTLRSRHPSTPCACSTGLRVPSRAASEQPPATPGQPDHSDAVQRFLRVSGHDGDR